IEMRQPIELEPAIGGTRTAELE
ncbi:uncharacterized, partial [Tachysurus ichikawai]